MNEHVTITIPTNQLYIPILALKRELQMLEERRLDYPQLFDANDFLAVILILASLYNSLHWPRFDSFPV